MIQISPITSASKAGANPAKTRCGQWSKREIKAKDTISPTALMPKHKRAWAYVIPQTFPFRFKMPGASKWLILCRTCAFLLFCKHGLTQADSMIPTLKSEEVQLIEVAQSEEGEHRYLVSLPERFRQRHFSFLVDRSVCRGSLSVNGNMLPGEDATDTFRFDHSNAIVLKNCLERTPLPLRLFAHPKVYISEALGSYDVSGELMQLEVTIRNTLLNSTSISLDVPVRSEDFFLGPETSQTRHISVRLTKWTGNSLTLTMHKYPEAIEGEYRHIRIVSISRITK